MSNLCQIILLLNTVILSKLMNYENVIVIFNEIRVENYILGE